GIIRKLQEPAVGIGNLGHAVRAVVLHRRGTACIGRRGHVAAGIVAVIEVRAIGELLLEEQAAAVVGVGNDLAAPLHPAHQVAPRVVAVLFRTTLTVCAACPLALSLFTAACYI